MEPKISAYYKVAETIKNRILSGVYMKGDKVPASNVLADEFNTSEITIRKAMDLLKNDGLIDRKAGIGTIVREIADKRISMGITSESYWDWFGGTDLPLSKSKIDLLSIDTVKCFGRVSSLRRKEENCMLYRVKRLCSYENEPMSLYINYISTETITKSELEKLSQERFLTVLLRQPGLNVTRLEQTVETTSADLDMAQYLKINFGDALFFIRNTYFDADDDTVAITFMYHRGDRYRYKGNIERPFPGFNNDRKAV